MANSTQYLWTSTTYNCHPPGNYAERGYLEGYPVSFERKSANTATVKVNCKSETALIYVNWIRPGAPYTQYVSCEGVDVGSAGSTQQNNCTGNWGGMACSASGTYSFTQTSSNKTAVWVDGRWAWTGRNWNTIVNTWSGNGWSTLKVELGNGYRVLPPKNLTGSITYKNSTRVKASCSLDSWSDNGNIKGTPYTGNGGRNWNFQAQIKNGSSVLKTLTKNTGETKSADFDFTGLNLPVDVNLTMLFTASNNYQQTITYSVSFKIDSLGYVTTTASSKRIKYITITYPYDVAQDNPSLAPLAGATKYVYKRAKKI